MPVRNKTNPIVRNLSLCYSLKVKMNHHQAGPARAEVMRWCFWFSCNLFRRAPSSRTRVHSRPNPSRMKTEPPIMETELGNLGTEPWNLKAELTSINARTQMGSGGTGSLTHDTVPLTPELANGTLTHDSVPLTHELERGTLTHDNVPLTHELE